MSISIQDFEADIPELAGAVCERLLCVQSKQENGRIVPCVFWLKIRDGRWHRFFVDAWVLHWDEQDTLDEDDLTDPDFPVLDAGAHYRLVGTVVSKIEMRQTSEDPEFDARLTIFFGDGRASVLQHSAEEDSRMSVIQHDAPSYEGSEGKP